jgi:hypothetical protein
MPFARQHPLLQTVFMSVRVMKRVGVPACGLGVGAHPGRTFAINVHENPRR